MMDIDGAFLHFVAPKFRGQRAKAQAEIIGQIDKTLRPTLSRYGISTQLRIAHFTAQIMHESAGLRTTEEFASGKAYEGRASLGNNQPGDGPRFKGRGLLQLTGRANYQKMGHSLDVDLINNPDKAADPKLSLLIACEYWDQRAINRHADHDDLIEVTRAVNGGLNGLADRRRYLSKAKEKLAELAAQSLKNTLAPHDPHSILRRGSKGLAVADLQESLRHHGYQLTIDGDFGPATELAVRTFQAASSLVPDGLVGPKTKSSLANWHSAF